MPSTGTGQAGTPVRMHQAETVSSLQQTAAYVLRFTRTQAGSPVKTDSRKQCHFITAVDTTLHAPSPSFTEQHRQVLPSL